MTRAAHRVLRGVLEAQRFSCVVRLRRVPAAGWMATMHAQNAVAEPELIAPAVGAAALRAQQARGIQPGAPTFAPPASTMA